MKSTLDLGASFLFLEKRSRYIGKSFEGLRRPDDLRHRIFENFRIPTAEFLLPERSTMRAITPIWRTGFFNSCAVQPMLYQLCSVFCRVEGLPSSSEPPCHGLSDIFPPPLQLAYEFLVRLS